jgi:glycosyltransferase involved in cell wall biosynthesis|tara:strand:+ start:3698 stop:4444 length:747 start_codon:yes stop_codon:yes gene_type:complete
MPTKLSILYLSYNEADIIAKSLASVEAVADEIILIDSGSTDSTVKIAENHGATVFHKPLDNWGNQRNWGLRKCQYNWILVIDCDEVLTDELVYSLQHFKRNVTETDQMPRAFKRVHYFKGKKMNFSGLQRDLITRLLPSGVLFNELMVHEKVRNQALLIEGSILHYTYKSSEHWHNKFQQYAKRQALDYDSKTGKVTAWHSLIKPSYRFFKHYVLKGGIFDGALGLEYSLWMFRAVKWRYDEIKKLRA